MNKGFDYKSYWQSRLKNAGDSLRGVGHRRFSEYTNSLMYKKTEGELKRALEDLKINVKGKTVLDAGSGVGFYTKFYLDRGAKALAVDISKDALNILKKKYSKAEVKQVGLDNLEILEKKRFDLVHCFDVLYHIVDNDELDKAINNICSFSKRYIILHDAPTYWGKMVDFLFKRKHINIRRSISIADKIKQKGFVEIGRYPTNIIFARPPITLIVNMFPYFFFLFDKFLIRNLHVKGIETNCIRIFEKKDAKN